MVIWAGSWEFCVVCGETGIAPVPVPGGRFDSFDAAGAAVEAESSVQFATAREVVDHERRHGLPGAESNVTLPGDGYDEWPRIENASVVSLSGPDSLRDDELASRQLDSKP